MFRVSDYVRGRLEIATAANEELATPTDLLPFLGFENMLNERVKDLEPLILGGLDNGVRLDRPETLLAAKAYGGFRPVSVLDPETRIVYRALVDVLEQSVSDAFRSKPMTYQAFVHAPLELNPSHIVIADVAAFYQFVSHALLATELVGLTGEAEVVNALADLLSLMEGGASGLPQGYKASEFLSELFIDRIERNLVRAGVEVWRYRDDFRIAAPSLSDAQRCLELLYRETKACGLTLNDQKTWIVPVEKYIELEVFGQWGEIVSEVDEDLAGWDPYGDDEGGDDEGDRGEGASIDAATLALERWSEDFEKNPTADGLRHLVRRRLLGAALHELSERGSPAAAKWVSVIVDQEPSFLPRVTRYLSSISQDDRQGAVIEVARKVSDGDIYLTDWQALWVLSSFANDDEPESEVLRWVQTRAESAHSATLRAMSMRFLAKSNKVDSRDLAAALRAMQGVAALNIVAAIGVLTDEGDRLRCVTEKERPMYAWIIDAMTE